MSQLHPWSVRTALYSVFVQPALTAERHTAAPSTLLRHCRFQSSEDSPSQGLSKYQLKLARKKQEQAVQLRAPQATYTPVGYGPRQSRREPALRPARPPRLPPLENRAYQAPYDDEIPSSFVAFIDRDGEFHPRVRLREVLNRLNRTEEHLVQMTPADPEDPQSLPMCRIFTKSRLRERRKQMDEKEKARKRQAGSAKVIEMYWVIEKKDLELKLKQFTTFLSEARLVDVFLEPKRRGRIVGPDECRQLLKVIQDAATGVKGKERAPPEGNLGRKMTLKYQGQKEEQ